MPVRSLAVILNPAAGNGRAGRARAPLQKALDASGARFELLTTERPNQASQLARRVAARFDAVVAAGGDGTVREVAAGVLGTGAALGVVPLGTGNDFARLLGMPTGPGAAVGALLDAPAVPVDGGLVRWRERDSVHRHEAVFVNAVGVGFDALVAAEAARSKWTRGLSGYIAAVARTLRAWPQPEVEARGVGADGEEWDVYTGHFFLAAVGNGTSVGGGFRLTPDARIDDGLLDLCFVAGPLSLGRIVRVLPCAIRGRHLSEPEVRSGRVRQVSLRSASGLPVHADGEVLTRAAVTVAVEVVPAAFQMLRPVRR